LNSTVTAYGWNEQSGILTSLETVQLLPEDFKGNNKSADIHLSPDGQFLYASNRGHNSITAFRVEPDGRLELVGIYPSGGDFPRNFYITPRGKYLLVENKHSGNIVLFRLDLKTGKLERKEKVEGMIAPQCMKMLPVK
jgi:6-phosphogluconolactonase